MHPRLFTLILFAGMIASPMCWAYPEMFRHGYTSCTPCHSSPTGGGILTTYGRSLSGEVLSQWSEKGEEGFLYGFLKTPSAFQIGGDLRAIQTYRDSHTAKDMKFTTMQMDVEAALTLDKFTLASTLGYLPATKETPSKTFSPRHYLMFQASENLSFRVGKFQRAYGINQPDHFYSVRRRTGFVPGSEAYHIEGYLNQDAYDVYATLTAGDLTLPAEKQEKGVTVRPSVGFEHIKLGLSYSYLFNAATKTQMAGPYLFWKLSKDLLLASEFDWIERKDNFTKLTGTVATSKLSYEIVKGVQSYFLHDVDWIKSGDAAHSLGIGAQLFPRPHIELNGLYMRSLMGDIRSVETAILMMHFYL